MSFNIQDLVLSISKDLSICPPKLTCFQSEIPTVASLGTALGTQNPSMVAIQEVSTQIQGDPTPLQLQILDAKLREALLAVQTQLT